MSAIKLQRQRWWTIMRQRSIFTVEDLGNFPGADTYLNHLIAAGYAESIAPGYATIFRLVTPTGPLAPHFHQGQLNDPNLQGGSRDIAQRTWQILRMSKQVSLHDLHSILQVQSRNKISEYCAKLLDARLLLLVTPPATAHASSYCYQLPVNLGPIAPIPTAEGVWDCNANPEVLYEYQP